MSSTNPNTRGGDGADNFPTDPRITADFLRRAGHRLPAGRWVEPAVGDGAIIKAVETWRPGEQSWTAVDIRHDRNKLIQSQSRGLVPVVNLTLDWTKDLPLDASGFDEAVSDAAVYITNPPFSLAEDFALRCFARGHGGSVVVLLLRINFLGSFDRLTFWQKHPKADIYPIVPRPSFSPDGKTDSCEYAWFFWAPDSIGRIYHPDAPWREETRKRKRQGAMT